MPALGSTLEITHPCPDAWKKSHCSCCIFSSKEVAEILPSKSYFSTRYVMIASDSLGQTK